MQFHYVSEMREVIDLALLNEKVEDAIDLTIKEEPKPVLN